MATTRTSSTLPPAPSSTPTKQKPVVKFVAIGVITLVAAWLVMTTTLGSVLAQSQPGLALVWAPRNSQANGDAAFQLLQDQPDHPDWAAIVPLARTALLRSPADVSAVTMLAVDAEAHGKPALAARLFNDSARLSRHVLITQIYLIQAAVTRGDVAAALVHYNIGLSTAEVNATILMPVLVSASASPAVAGPLAHLLLRRPIWWADFTRRLVETKADPGPSFPILLRGLRLNPDIPAERAMLSSALDRLIDAGHGSIAYALYRQATPSAPAVATTVRNGDFDGANRLPPFDWGLRNDDGVSAYIQPSTRGNALFVSAQTPSEVASQRLLLTPGRYFLGARIGSENGQGVETTLSVSCDGAAQPLAAVHAAADTTAAAVRQDFTIPQAGCADQKLTVSVTPGDRMGGQSWIDDVAVNPMP